ncbi:MAG TPA: tetratricopeptide repeat protein [Candidatus Sulfotelmatobacter sp.]|nr:tetratricopeptide repeat protein [Candidatus Sulfotelmatobacter sp.]
MSRSSALSLLLISGTLAALLVGCSRDPNVRKQKYFESGERYFAKGKYREAAIQYANAAQVDPRFAQAHYQLGETYLKLRDWNRAYQELSRAVELNPDNYSAHVDLANLLISGRNLTEAQPHLDFLRSTQPNSAETYEAWANLYAAQDNLATAIQQMQLAVAADPKRAESFLNLGLLQLRADFPDQAEGNFKKAAELDPKAMNAQLALGGFYQSRNRPAEAEQQFHHAIDVDPKDPAPRAALVRLLMAEGKKDETEAFLRQTKKDLPDNSEGYRMLGDYYFANGDIDKATAEYASLFSDHSHDLQVKKNYIQLLILKNRVDEAAKLNDELLKTNSRDVDALVYKGQIQLRRNDINGAVDALQSALRNDQDNAVAHYQLGLAFIQQHNEARAESEWRDAVRLRPDLTDAQRSLASLELSRGEIDALMNTAQGIIDAQPYSPDGYLLRSVGEINRQRYADAERDLHKAMDIAPTSAAPYVQMGNIRMLQKQYAEAGKFFQQGLEKDPASSDALGGLMNSYIEVKQPDKAIEAAIAQIAKSPNNSGFYDLLGTALFDSKKDIKGADAALRRAIELDKSNSDALIKFGKVQVAEGSADQALATYKQSIKDNPREISFYILAGELYESQNKWDDAKSMYQQALNVQPDNPLAANNLAYVILQQGGNVDVAMAMAQTARRGMPDSPNAADTLGWAYYQKGVYQSAIDLFQESLRLNEKHGGSDDASVHYHLGLAYQKANQPGLARQQLERALKISPNDANARKALEALRS